MAHLARKVNQVMRVMLGLMDLQVNGAVKESVDLLGYLVYEDPEEIRQKKPKTAKCSEYCRKLMSGPGRRCGRETMGQDDASLDREIQAKLETKAEMDLWVLLVIQLCPSLIGRGNLYDIIVAMATIMTSSSLCPLLIGRGLAASTNQRRGISTSMLCRSLIGRGLTASTNQRAGISKTDRQTDRQTDRRKTP
ncbi:unnamed protein product [Ranitomeya imitator]|uniref:Uncharacterized protein n=1 Tax=Ranitomeya imitator TaxID=111125 RepID=A0ABN9M0K9_9NEOB|nr:unnamed protein product [Ranitomeya imitator]